MEPLAEPAAAQAVAALRPRLRVMAVDDHPVLLEGLIETLEADLEAEMATSATCGADAELRYKAVQPDVLILDRRLPDADGLDVADRILAYDPDARILIYSADATPDDVRRASDIGCMGYVTKDASRAEVCKAVSEVASGRHFTSEKVGKLLFVPSRRRNANPADTPTAREQEVLELFCEGLDPTEIARQLNISPLTVKTHEQKLHKRLDVNSRAAMVAKALRDGIVDR